MKFIKVTDEFKNKVLSHDCYMYPLFEDTLFQYMCDNKVIYVSNEECDEGEFIMGVINNVYDYDGDDENITFSDMSDIISHLKTHYNITHI